ncbi:MAG TPA: sigma-70 family RNA polymerase sigma factor [Phycisphaerae bacterium]|nr:sigma-70 family RNA polymerase sigma factor [Phycisphaerae bacterium]
MLSHAQLIELQPTLRRIAGDEDAVQDANLRLLKHAHLIRDPLRYASRTARTCRLEARRGKCETVSLAIDAPLVDPSPTPAQSAADAEDREMLRSAIRNLPVRQRDAVLNPCRANNSNRHKALRSLRMELGAPSRRRG